MRVPRPAHDPGIDGFGGDIDIYYHYDKGWNDEKREIGFPICDDTKRTECWSGGILSEISEANGRRDDKEDD